MIKILATKKKIDLVLVHSYSACGTYQMALTDLLKWLLKMPRDKIVEVGLYYFSSVFVDKI